MKVMVIYYLIHIKIMISNYIFDELNLPKTCDNEKRHACFLSDSYKTYTFHHMFHYNFYAS